MSDIMLIGVLNMPLPTCECLRNPLSQVAQFVSRGRQAADLIEQQAAQIERQRALLAEAQNALIDYVERLEKQGGAMNYGRSVLRQIDAALAEGKV